jgi:hypothetical protein
VTGRSRVEPDNDASDAAGWDDLDRAYAICLLESSYCLARAADRECPSVQTPPRLAAGRRSGTRRCALHVDELATGVGMPDSRTIMAASLPTPPGNSVVFHPCGGRAADRTVRANPLDRAERTVERRHASQLKIQDPATGHCATLSTGNLIS